MVISPEIPTISGNLEVRALSCGLKNDMHGRLYQTITVICNIASTICISENKHVVGT